jgi:hypothetical protein
MNPRSLCALFAAVLLAGCGEKSPPPAAAPSPEPAAQVEATSAPATAPVVAASGNAEADTTATLAMLTQTLRRFSAEKQRVPASLNELISARYLTSLPPAPAGKKFAINPKRVEVILEGQ